ncbi:L-lactate dehydrogenase [Cystobacter fuscus DSM 2262]|uniref:L-lactate dehydrogenase n=1 Tax=Cystobacter fuscus (strain ATCC 25194 / DSM 2262 / NBRC 100088 / M29) TaxID=1242864 RepID=S9R3S0_CYSF2|nr:L-lactate dehydrogenase [Cystobacter fuscus]EPX63538.1 L-lactate dehydrogenase [Cystobacter fuscus DSM 2262]
MSKIAIIGAGAVGATVAYASMIRGVAKNIAIYDVNRAKVDAEVLDLNHGLQFVPMATLEGSDDIGVCAGADVIVITAGAKQKPGQTRMELAEANVALCRSLVPQLLKVAPDALLLLVTNPVDVLTYVVQKLSGLPTRRVLGSGTVLDSSRFRFLLARHLNVAVQNVHAIIAGEHGDSELPLWSLASVGGVPLMQWAVPGRARLTDEDRQRIFDNVRNAAYQVIQGKGATNYAIGLATAQILEALLHNEQRVLPVSSRLEGYLGIQDVCMSVPSIVNRGGVEAVLELPLNESEREGLKHSADTIRKAIRTLGF